MKKKMLHAVKENWGLMGPGSWEKEQWTVYYDHTYKVKVVFRPKDKEPWDYKPTMTKSGKMGEKKFKKLKALLDKKEWVDPDIEIFACDGVAWKITYLSCDGEIINSSGKLDYIYGQKHLTEITAALPELDESYEASAYINVTRKSQEERSERPATLSERWAEDPVPFRVYRDGKWLTPQELAEEEKKGKG